MLLQSYPEYVKVDNLPVATVNERIEVASVLYDKGLLTTGEPLDSVHEELPTDDEADYKFI